jgi:hypothetical protein
MSRKFNHAILRIKNADGKYDALSALRGQNSYELAVKAGFQGTEEEWMDSIIGDGWIGAFQEVDTRVAALEGSTKLVISNTVVGTSAFTYDSTYTDYPYRAAIVDERVTSNMIPEVIFGIDDCMSGVFAPIANTYDGGVYIYTAGVPDEIVIIPTIIIWR